MAVPRKITLCSLLVFPDYAPVSVSQRTND